MVEKYPGPTPDGRQTATWYRLSREETLKLVEDGVLSLVQGKTIDDLVDAEILAYPGRESEIEKMIRSWGLDIQPIGKG